MQMAGTDLDSLATEARAPQGAGDLVDGDGQASTDAAEPQMKGDAPGGEGLEQPETVQVALAVCQQVADGELTVAAVAQPVAVGVPVPQTFEDEFRDFDLAPFTLVRLSVKRALD